MSCANTIQTFGTNPINAQWKINKGNTSVLEITFLEQDEVTPFDITGWTVVANVYDKYNDSLTELTTGFAGETLIITASADQTSTWGPANRFSIAELRFEVVVTIPQMGDDYIWTPISGTICLLSDVATGGSL